LKFASNESQHIIARLDVVILIFYFFHSALEQHKENEMQKVRVWAWRVWVGYLSDDVVSIQTKTFP